jgi:hypothetical protein
MITLCPGDWVVLKDTVADGETRGVWIVRTLFPSLVLDVDGPHAWMSDSPNGKPLDWWSATTANLRKIDRPLGATA